MRTDKPRDARPVLCLLEKINRFREPTGVLQNCRRAVANPQAALDLRLCVGAATEIPGTGRDTGR